MALCVSEVLKIYDFMNIGYDIFVCGVKFPKNGTVELIYHSIINTQCVKPTPVKTPSHIQHAHLNCVSLP